MERGSPGGRVSGSLNSSGENASGAGGDARAKVPEDGDEAALTGREGGGQSRNGRRRVDEEEILDGDGEDEGRGEGTETEMETKGRWMDKPIGECRRAEAVRRGGGEGVRPRVAGP